jgi:hypothetical protein
MSVELVSIDNSLCRDRLLHVCRILNDIVTPCASSTQLYFMLEVRIRVG